MATEKRSVEQIVTAMEVDGTDCTEKESAVLKFYMREHPDTTLAERARLAFPLEYDEVCDGR